MRVPRLVVAGTESGAGKTTVALGLMRALRRRGLRVQPFKVGPDYIDPTYHTAATGRPSRNLDGWMCGEDLVRALFARAAGPADVAVIEGVMGLFDSAGPATDSGSTAEVARWLDAPVILVVDASGMARSAAAMVRGYATFDPGVRIAGVVFNRVGSPGHFELLRESLAAYGGPPALGYLPRADGLQAPERHLGLVPVLDPRAMAPYLDRVADAVAATVDLDRVLAIARAAGPVTVPDGAGPFPDRPAPGCCRIAIARDAAFHFYYEDGLDLLAALGVEWAPFSPLAGESIPPGTDALYLGGGFPEVYRAELSAHDKLRADVQAAHRAGMPVYAECGGLMYLSRAIVDPDGQVWPMAGLLPVSARMQPRLAALGYARATFLQETLLGSPGDEVLGHEFHWSVTDPHPPDWPPAYRFRGRRVDGKEDGFARPALLASYLHLHFVANPHAARRFVQAAARYRAVRLDRERAAARPVTG
ncbi:cobyrinate a,c-diamide synthase [Caldinitratiruptor microaerophilus]|nr:cobyrinate a,c-diamide synthase [Caldinitratiruptor microaerophilus]